VTASATLLLFSATVWWLVDGPMLFFAVGIYLAILTAFAACVVWSIRQLWKFGWRSGTSAAVCLVAGLMWWFVPFTSLWIQANYRRHRAEREAIVAKITSGQLRPNVPCCPSLIALGPDTAYVSMGGNQVSVEEHDGKKYVMFYTFRGILDRYSGFLFVPDNGEPSRFSDLDEADRTELVRFSDHWVWASHH